MNTYRRCLALSVLIAAFFVIVLSLSPSSLFLEMETDSTNSKSHRKLGLFHRKSSILQRKSSIIHRKSPKESMTMKQPQKEITPNITNMIYYHNNPQVFVDKLASCLESWKCSVLFHHLGKTGGSVVRDKLFDNYPPNEKMYHKVGGEYWDDWMNGNMTKLFNENKEKYCRSKFSSYQDVDFKQIVSQCRYVIDKCF